MTEIFDVMAKAKGLVLKVMKECGYKEIVDINKLGIFIRSCKHQNKNWFIEAMVVDVSDKMRQVADIEMRMSESGELRAYEFRGGGYY